MEFLQKAKTNGDDVFLKRLLSSSFDKEELNKKTLLKIRKARFEIKKKKFSSLDKLMKEFWDLKTLNVSDSENLS